MGAGPSQSRAVFRPFSLRTYVRAEEVRRAAGSEATTGPRLVPRTDRARTGSRKVVGQRMGASPAVIAGAGARRASPRPSHAKAADLALEGAAPVWTVQASPASRVLQPARRGSAVLVPIMLRSVLPGARRASSSPVVRRETCASASVAPVPRGPPSADAVRGLRPT